jgi:ABC-type amino acid transport substrate-binding protein
LPCGVVAPGDHGIVPRRRQRARCNGGLNCREHRGKMTSAGDLKDKRIGVLLGSVYDRFATNTYPQATVLHFDTPSDLQLAVLAGKVDAGLSDEQPIAEVLRTNNDLAMFGEPLLTLPLGVGFRKGNTGQIEISDMPVRLNCLITYRSRDRESVC